MNSKEIANIYRQESIHGNHPVELVVKMYEGVLEDFRRALNAVNAGHIQARTSSLNHALQIIAELQSVLDHERGGEVSRRLDGFYNVTRALVVEANIQSKPEPLQKLVDLYLPLRQAWKTVEQEASTGKVNAEVRPRLDAGQAAAFGEPPQTTSLVGSRPQRRVL